MPRKSTTSSAVVQSVHQRTVEFKLYPNKQQVTKLEEYLRICCWVYNQALEQRIKRRKRGERVTNYYDQQRLLTGWRARISWVKAVPVEFTRHALRRVDQAWTKTTKAKLGFPRFKPRQRYNSLESLKDFNYVRGKRVYAPGIGSIPARGAFALVPNGLQKLLRIVRRSSGWYVQIVVDAQPKPIPIGSDQVGIDLGLTDLVTVNDGTKVGNPRLLRKAAAGLRQVQKSLSRRKTGSNRRKKAARRVGLLYERLKRKRLGLAHRVSRFLVNKYAGIAHESLNLKGLSRGRLRKHVLDAAWGQLLRYLTYKAVSAGRVVIAVDPRYTSQECPACGRRAPKKLSDRVHSCSCGLVCDRDVAAALVIRDRGFSPGRGGSVSPPVGKPTGGGP